MGNKMTTDNMKYYKNVFLNFASMPHYLFTIFPFYKLLVFFDSN